LTNFGLSESRVNFHPRDQKATYLLCRRTNLGALPEARHERCGVRTANPATRDIEAIKELKTSYRLHLDNANEAGYVSPQDRVWESDKFGRFEGREAIRGLFRSLPETLHFAIHYILNPIIEVNRERATGVQFGYGFY